MDSLIQELEWGKDSMNKDYEQLPSDSQKIDASMFEFVQRESKINDTKIKTKRISYFKDAMIRFRRNKASVVASTAADQRSTADVNAEAHIPLISILLAHPAERPSA